MRKNKQKENKNIKTERIRKKKARKIVSIIQPRPRIMDAYGYHKLSNFGARKSPTISTLEKFSTNVNFDLLNK